MDRITRCEGCRCMKGLKAIHHQVMVHCVDVGRNVDRLVPLDNKCVRLTSIDNRVNGNDSRGFGLSMREQIQRDLESLLGGNR